MPPAGGALAVALRVDSCPQALARPGLHICSPKPQALVQRPVRVPCHGPGIAPPVHRLSSFQVSRPRPSGVSLEDEHGSEDTNMRKPPKLSQGVARINSESDQSVIG